VEERDNIPAGVRFRDGPRPIANVSDPGLRGGDSRSAPGRWRRRSGRCWG